MTGKATEDHVEQVWSEWLDVLGFSVSDAISNLNKGPFSKEHDNL
jgi:hypothetical protein